LSHGAAASGLCRRQRASQLLAPPVGGELGQLYGGAREVVVLVQPASQLLAAAISSVTAALAHCRAVSVCRAPTRLRGVPVEKGVLRSRCGSLNVQVIESQALDIQRLALLAPHTTLEMTMDMFRYSSNRFSLSTSGRLPTGGSYLAKLRPGECLEWNAEMPNLVSPNNTPYAPRGASWPPRTPVFRLLAALAAPEIQKTVLGLVRRVALSG
jgi:hypothetical protein